MIGIIGAMGAEVDMLKALMEQKRTETVSGVDFVSGALFGRDIVVAVSGIGKVLASVCAQAMILSFSPEMIINTGVAGALDDSLEICDVVVADSVLQHDLDMTPLGFPMGYIPEWDTVSIPCDEKLRDALLNQSSLSGLPLKRGIIASGDIFMTDASVKENIRRTFNASACDMESASIGLTCYVNQIPFAVIRAISDNADGEADSSFEEFLDSAARRSAQIIEEFIKGIETN